MKAFLYGISLQCKLDIRSKALLITCYLVPLVFYVLMGGIFTSIMPDMKASLISTMIVMGVSMGAFIGLPPSLIETYATDIKKSYKANGVPLYLGLVSMFLSSFVHLMIMCLIILFTAPIFFDAILPAELPSFFAALIIYITASLGAGSVLGLAVKSQTKLNMYSQLIFLPSIMLSGIMFPASLLPKPLILAGKLFPASWGYLLMLNDGLRFDHLWYPVLLFLASAAVCSFLLKKK